MRVKLSFLLVLVFLTAGAVLHWFWVGAESRQVRLGSLQRDRPESRLDQAYNSLGAILTALRIEDKASDAVIKVLNKSVAGRLEGGPRQERTPERDCLLTFAHTANGSAAGLTIESSVYLINNSGVQAEAVIIFRKADGSAWRFRQAVVETAALMSLFPRARPFALGPMEVEA